jgi:hypothetical protein
MPVEKPKSLNFGINPIRLLLERLKHFVSTECKISQSHNKLLPHNLLLYFGKPSIYKKTSKKQQALTYGRFLKD